jgi:hypothetical protein|nr:MAG TPA: hypothetical protein [Caudoviricetes sp.]
MRKIRKSVYDISRLLRLIGSSIREDDKVFSPEEIVNTVIEKDTKKEFTRGNIYTYMKHLSEIGYLAKIGHGKYLPLRKISITERNLKNTLELTFVERHKIVTHTLLQNILPKIEKIIIKKKEDKKKSSYLFVSSMDRYLIYSIEDKKIIKREDIKELHLLEFGSKIEKLWLNLKIEISYDDKNNKWISRSWKITSWKEIR